MDARPGDVLAGKFRVERTIGSGGMGTVLEATDTVLGRRVAIKVTSDALAADPSASARFLREARSMAALRGAGFVRVFEVGTLERRTPFIVMELLEGEDLRARFLRSGPLPLGDLVELVAQTCEALAEAHATGLVHRDIKPSNLFVERRPDGRPMVRVLDLGISKPADEPGAASLTASSGTLGSPRYMSPEQALDPRDVDARSDVWSLGVTLYELWTGKPPFEGPSHLRLCKAILENEPVPPSALRPGTPPAFEAVILRCLRKRPEDRFQDVAQLAEALAAIDARAAAYASAARVFAARRPASRDGSDTEVDAKSVPGPDHTETSMPVSRSSPGTPAPAKSSRTPVAIALAIAGIGAVVAGGGALYVFSREDAALGAARIPSKLVAAKRTLVNEAVAERAPAPTGPAGTETRGKPVMPAAHKPSAREDDPLSSSH